SNRNVVLAVNGEIYNHQQLRRELSNYGFSTQVDSEVILALYEHKGPHFIEDLNGIFAFALYDVEKDAYLVARDHMGIIPLYMGWDEAGTFYVASELKALEGYCSRIETFPPGHYIYSSEGNTPKKWYKRDWEQYEAVKDNVTDIAVLRKGL